MLKSDFLRSQIICSLLRDWHICTIQCNCVQQLSLNLQVFLAVACECWLSFVRIQTADYWKWIYSSLAPLWKTLKKRNLMGILGSVITKKSWILIHKDPCFYYSTVWLDRGKKSVLLNMSLALFISSDTFYIFVVEKWIAKEIFDNSTSCYSCLKRMTWKVSSSLKKQCLSEISFHLLIHKHKREMLWIWSLCIVY